MSCLRSRMWREIKLGYTQNQRLYKVRRMNYKLRIAKLAAAAAAFALAGSVPALQGCGGGDSCCRVCSTGKACGDSCIPTSQTCSQPTGCACNE